MSEKITDQTVTINEHAQQAQIVKPTHTPSLQISWARHQDEVEEAQRLRYKVFVEEMGANLPKAKNGLDQDLFDAWCDHLIVRDEETLRVVGTYRVLTPHQARKLGSLYSETEFDLTRLTHLRPKMIELGRSCVHQDYRTGSVIMALWSGIGRYMVQGGYEKHAWLRQCVHGRWGPLCCQLVSTVPSQSSGRYRISGFPAVGSPGRQPEPGAAGRASTPGERLLATGCQNLWCPRLGPGFQHRGFPHIVTATRSAPPLCPPFSGRACGLTDDYLPAQPEGTYFCSRVVVQAQLVTEALAIAPV